MGRKRTSFAFLMEMLWVCGFFIVAACIFVLAFVKADQMSRGAKDLNQAVLTAENTIEHTFLWYEEPNSSGEQIIRLFFDKNWTPLSSFDGGQDETSPAEAAYLALISTQKDEGLLRVSVNISDMRGTVIYSLEGARCISPALQ